MGEAATVFGGEENLRTGIANVARVYHPSMIGLASTCLTETIGKDVPAMIARLRDPDEGLRRPRRCRGWLLLPPRPTPAPS